MVSFYGLSALRSIRFPSLVRVEQMGLWGTLALEELDFPSLTSAGSIGPEATGLSDVAGLEPLAELESINLHGNPRLVSLNGLDLASLQRLKIEDNDSLTTLADLNKLTDIEEYLWIVRNAGLVSLDGTENLERVGQQLVIADNPVLPTCEAGA